MNKLLAVSGGVDSMVLLDMFSHEDDVFVAHFNHGTRISADDDEAFVKRIAEEKYHKKFFSKKTILGANVSESAARTARYDFLQQLAKELDAEIYTAHHVDDLVESVAINLSRGTGWRGLAVFGQKNITRPFVEKQMTKKDIIIYAAKHNIIYREDPTNVDEKYLRNRIRENLKTTPIDKQEIVKLWEQQKILSTEIHEIMHELKTKDNIYQREDFESMDETVAIELLRFILSEQNISATRPQLLDFLNAIKTYAPEKSFNLPGGKLIKLHKNFFTC